MASTLQWPVFNGSENPIDILVGVSRYYGADPDFVLAGGGNTSVKIGDRLLVKGSGHALATIGPEGFVDLDRNALQALLGRELSADKKQREEQFKQAVMAARLEPQKNQRPSVEAVLHHLMPGQFVVHTHATLVNAFTCCRTGKQLIQQALANDVIWIDDVDPGFVLAKTLQNALKAFEKKTGKSCPRAVIMQNHGLVVSGDSPAVIKQNTDWLLGELSALLNKTGGNNSFGPLKGLEAAQARTMVSLIGPALRGLLSSGEALKVVTFDDSQEVISLVAAESGKDVATTGPLTPDQIVYCKSFPLWFETQAGESAQQLVQRLTRAVADYQQAHRVAPNVVLVKGLGMFTAGDGWSAANTVRVVYIDAIKVMAAAHRLGGIGYLNAELRKFIEEWEVESYRRQVAAAKAGAGRAVGKVAVVTGAAQGFGLEIAQDLAAQGGHVVLTDMNADGAKKPPPQSAKNSAKAGPLACPSTSPTARPSKRRSIRSSAPTAVWTCWFPTPAYSRPAASRPSRRRTSTSPPPSTTKAISSAYRKRPPSWPFSIRSKPITGATSSRSTPRAVWWAPTRTAPTPAASSAASGSPSPSPWNWSKTASRSTPSARATSSTARSGPTPRPACSCST